MTGTCIEQPREPEREIVRLFPPDRDGATLHVIAQGARIGVSADSLVVTPREGDGPASKHPIRPNARPIGMPTSNGSRSV